MAATNKKQTLMEIPLDPPHVETLMGRVSENGELLMAVYNQAVDLNQTLFNGCGVDGPYNHPPMESLADMIYTQTEILEQIQGILRRTLEAL